MIRPVLKTSVSIITTHGLVMLLLGNRPRHHSPPALPAAPDARRCGSFFHGEIHQYLMDPFDLDLSPPVLNSSGSLLVDLVAELH